MSAGRLSKHHYMSDKCKQGKEIRLRNYTLQRCFEANRVLLQTNVETLPPSEVFPYLGRTITYNNSDWATVYQNFRKARRRWGMIARVLESTGTAVWAWRAMYKEVAQLVLLYEIESWAVTWDMLKFLTTFHHRAARRIMGMTANRGAGRE